MISRASVVLWVTACLFVLLWLLLPQGTWVVGPVWIRKEDAVRLLTLLWVACLLPQSLRFRWHWVDGAVVVYCLCPLICGVANHLDWAESLWETVKEFAYWFVPYLLGRAVFGEPRQARVLATVLVIGAAVYLPLTIVEIFYGPVFTEWFTGAKAGGQWIGAGRGTTFRPSVFLANGFVLTMFYVLASLSAWALWRQHSAATKVRPLFLVAALAFPLVVVGAKSLGSIFLLAVGLVCLAAMEWESRVRGDEEVRWNGSASGYSWVRWVVVALASLAPLYIGLRLSGWLTTAFVQSLAERVVSAERAGSLVYRLRAEDIVFEAMRGHWLCGWGDFNLWQQGRAVKALDGFWLFALTRSGLLSVAAWLAMVLGPIALFARSRQDHRRAPFSFVFALFLALSLIDSMFNYFGDAPQMLVLGALASGALYGRRIAVAT